MEKKHIGLLTLPLDSNYGGILQLVALQAFLMQNGYKTTLINLRHPESLKKRVVRSVIENQTLLDIKNIRFRKRISRELHDFISKQIENTTAPLYSREDFLNEVARLKFDAIVVGSDQVWRIDYLYGIWHSMFLNGIDKTKTKKISYAASFGKSQWEYPKIKEEVKILLNDFDAISVREDSGVVLCKNEFGINDAIHVVDPTLLINKDFYNKFVTKGKPKRGIYTYILDGDNENQEVLNYVKASLNKTVYSINVGKPVAELKKLKNYKKPSMQDWLQSFHDADFVVTDSFHGTIFSIIFNKPFLSIGNKKRGLTRFDSLLGMLNLKDRLIDVDDLSNLKNLNLALDFTDVIPKIEALKKASSEFLLSSLES